MPVTRALTLLICVAAGGAFGPMFRGSGALDAAALAAAQAAGAPSAIALMNVNVIPMNREHVLADQVVLIQDGTITGLGPAASLRIPHSVRRIDGQGKFVIPALAEMHAHIPGGDAPEADIERVLLLYVANGIGTIRGMLGHPRHLALRDRARNGAIVSPWIYTSGPSLNGNTVPTPDAARQAAREQKAAGYDFLKIHPGILRGPFDALAAAAKEAGIPMAGHVPADVGLQRALEVPYATIDHLDGYVEALAGPGGPPSQMFGLNLVDRIDESRIPALVEATRKAGVAQVPTQALFEHWVGMDDPDAMRQWPEMRYVDADTLANWVANKRKLADTATPENRQRFLEIRRRLLKAMHDGRVRLLLGSDAPQVWNVPGFSLHRELEYLVGAGLTPYEALETGTRHIAEFYGTQAERGTIEAGKRADLVVLEGNPLEDITQTKRISLVSIGKHVLTRDELDARLKELTRAD